MNAFLSGIGIPGFVSIAPSGQSNWWASISAHIEVNHREYQSIH
ncbi:MAG: hypothetical protein R3F28_18630 [Candidatus Kapaibacterium sp.]